MRGFSWREANRFTWRIKRRKVFLAVEFSGRKPRGSYFRRLRPIRVDFARRLCNYFLRGHLPVVGWPAMACGVRFSLMGRVTQSIVLA